MGARAASQQADYQADVQRNNALAAEFMQADAARRGEIEADQINRRIAAVTGMGRTAYAAGNVMLRSGSPASWEEDVAVLGAEDRAMSQYNTQMEQWGFGRQADDFRTRSRLASWQSGQSMFAGYLGAANSILGGTSQLGMSLSAGGSE